MSLDTKNKFSGDYVIENLADENFHDTFDKSGDAPSVPFIYSTRGTINRLRDKPKIISKSDTNKLLEN